MIWGFFSTVHIATLVAAAVMIVVLYFCIRNLSPRTQQLILLPFALLGDGAILYNLLMWGSPLDYLPLHLCSINALMLPIVVLTRNKTMGNLLLVWCLGALAALLMNFEMQNVELLSWTFFFYYFPHVFEFGIPLLLFKLGLVKKDHRCIGSTLVLTMCIYTLVHLCNKAIWRLCGVRTNYMFSVDPSNPLVALFHKLIPYEYWYMYMVLPIVAVYLIIVYAPQLRQAYAHRRNRNSPGEKIAHG